MQFQVPQFIEVEDKIFGPLTLKQFVYLAGGGATLFLLWVIFPFIIFIFFAIPIALFSVALAFFKLHGQPFIKVVENAFNYYIGGRIYTWKKKEKIIKREKVEEKATGQLDEAAIPRLTKRKLDDLAWSLDIKKDINNK